MYLKRTTINDLLITIKVNLALITATGYHNAVSEKRRVKVLGKITNAAKDRTLKKLLEFAWVLKTWLSLAT